MKSVVCGIDFGTTNSCIAVVRHGRAEVIPNVEGSPTTPSVAAFLAGGERVIGIAAKRQAVVNPQRTVSSVKRLLGRSWSQLEETPVDALPYRLVADGERVLVQLGDEQLAPEQLGALIVAKLKADAEAYLGVQIRDCVLAVPAYFNELERQAVKDAGTIAGLNVLRLVNEPTAAALAYGLDARSEGRSVIVFDLGGGTFDVSALRISGGRFRVLATAGDNQLGGDDVDHALAEALTGEFEIRTGIDIGADPVARQRLLEAAEKAKVELSSAPATDISLPFFGASENGPQHLQTTLTRAELERLAAPVLERLAAPIATCLEAAGLTIEAVDDLVLIGGMTRMPAVRQRLAALLGKEAHGGVNPDQAVALGAAIQAGAIKGTLADIVLVDVTPLGFGVELDNGAPVCLIPANTPLPAKTTERFTTSRDDQRSVEVRVVQGEGDLACETRLLGKLKLAPIPPAPRGEPQIDVSFELSLDGLLTVSALDRASGCEQQARIEAETALADDEVERMRSQAGAFLVEREERLRRATEANDAARSDSRGRLAIIDGELVEEETVVYE